MEIVELHYEYWSELLGKTTSHMKIMNWDDARYEKQYITEILGGTAKIVFLEEETA